MGGGSCRAPSPELRDLIAARAAESIPERTRAACCLRLGTKQAAAWTHETLEGRVALVTGASGGIGRALPPAPAAKGTRMRPSLVTTTTTHALDGGLMPA